MDIQTKIIIDRLLEDADLLNEIKRDFIAAKIFGWNQLPETQRNIANNCVDKTLERMTESGYEIESEVAHNELSDFFYISILAGIQKTDIHFFSRLIEIISPIRSGSRLTIQHFLTYFCNQRSDILGETASKKNKISFQVKKNQEAIIKNYAGGADPKYELNRTRKAIATAIKIISIATAINIICIATIFSPIITFSIPIAFLTFILTALITVTALALIEIKRVMNQIKTGINELITLDVESVESKQFKKKSPKKVKESWQPLIQKKQPVPTNSPDEQTTEISEKNEENSLLNVSSKENTSEIILTINLEAPKKENEPEQPKIKKPKRKYLNTQEVEEKIPNQLVKMDLPIPAPSTFGSYFAKLDPKFFTRMTSPGIGLPSNSTLYGIWDDVLIRACINFKSNAQVEAYHLLLCIFIRNNTAGPIGEDGTKYLKNLGLFAIKDKHIKSRVYGVMRQYEGKSCIHFQIFEKNGLH